MKPITAFNSSDNSNSNGDRRGRPELNPLGAAVAFVVDQLRFWLTLPFTFFLPPAPAPNPDVDRERIEATVAEIRRLLRVATSAGVDEDFAAALRKLAANRHKIERAIVVWVDLIEVLVQYEEKRYGPRAGLGQIKAAELKRILQVLLKNQEFDLPQIPEELRPLVLDYVIDFIVHAVVTACNNYGLWEQVEPRAGYPFRVFVAQFLNWLGRLFTPIIAIVARIIRWVRDTFQERVMLSPELQGALEAVQRDGMIAQSGDIIREVVNIIVWVGEHAKQVKAGFEVILTAVQEAERFRSLTGPEKKEYATNLILAVLEELGFAEFDGLLGAIIEAFISSGIEASVHLFNKHEVFAK